MSLFGSLITGVSALSAQAQSISMIANNIANVNTVGYKRREAAFQSLVTSESRNARYTPGSVLARAVQKIDSQGALQQTNSTTDVAISGNGFFVVQRTPTGLQEKLFTRAGSFSEDSNGYLRNTAGFYLMGWRIDENGQLPAGRDDISSLESVNVSLLGGLTKPTSTADFAINLDASEDMTAFPVGAAAAADFKRTLRVFDSLGEGQNLELQFVKHTSPTAYAMSAFPGVGAKREDLLTATAGVDVGETIDITVGAQTATFTVTANSTVQNLIDFVNNDINLQTVAAAELTTNGQIKVIARNFGDTATVVNGATVTGTGAATVMGFTATAAPAMPTIYPDVGTAGTPNAFGWWQLSLVDLDTGTVLGKGSLNFNSDGTLNGAQDINGQSAVQLSNINWGNGSALQNISLDIGSMTQFSGEYNVTAATQNGAELGLRTGVEIDRNGFVTARFSNGQTSKLFKLPLATFTAVNGLAEQSGNAFIQSAESGSYNLREAGSGGAGLVEGSAVETSNVDIADEFTKMIVTQRSYSAGTKVIRTADEMTEELLRLR